MFNADGHPLNVKSARLTVEEIRHARGHIDAADEAELGKTRLEWRERYIREKEEQRADYARYTKT
jgi:hypothetical protein